MLSIMVLHYRNNGLTDICCDSIDRLKISIAHEKVVVDNGSENRFPTREGWKVYRYTDNAGNIGGQRRCFANAEGDQVLFVSNDVRFITFREPISVFGMPTVYSPNFDIESKGLEFNWPGYARNQVPIWKLTIWEPNLVPGICYWMDKDLYHAIGGHDESFISSHEDVDISMRLRKLGIIPVIDTGFKVMHLGNQTLGTLPYYNRRLIHEARVKVIKKHFKGLDRAIRLAAVNTIDKLTGAY